MNLQLLLPFVCLLRQGLQQPALVSNSFTVAKHAFVLLTLAASTSQVQGWQVLGCHAQQGHCYLIAFPFRLANGLIQDIYTEYLSHARQ